MRYILIFYILNCVCLFSSEPKVECGNIQLYEAFRRNVIAYHLRYAMDYELDVRDNTNLLKKNSNYVFDKLLVGDTLDLNATKINLAYPDSSYVVYEFYLKGFNYLTPTGRRLKLNIFESFNCDNYYIVAFNNLTGNVKYISGNFFLNEIAHDYSLTSGDVKTKKFVEFLRLKTYKYQIDDISYLKKKGSSLVFEGYSMCLNRNVLLEVDVDNIDLVKVSIKSDK